MMDAVIARHDAQRKNRQPAQGLPPLKKVNQSENRSLPLLKKLLQQFRIDSRRRNVTAQPVHCQQAQRKQHAIAQIGRAEYVPENAWIGCSSQDFDLASGGRVIFCSSGRLKACACTVSATFNSPSPKIFQAFALHLQHAQPVQRSSGEIVSPAPKKR